MSKLNEFYTIILSKFDDISFLITRKYIYNLILMLYLWAKFSLFEYSILLKIS